MIRWNKSSIGHLKCSKCGYEPFWTFGDIPFHYCPYCGDCKDVNDEEYHTAIENNIKRSPTYPYTISGAGYDYVTVNIQ